MSEASLYRFGGWAALTGGTLGVVSLFLHTGPRRGNTTKFLADVAGDELWVLDHLGIIVAVLLLMAPLAAITRSITSDRAAPLASLGWTAAVVGAAVTLVYASIDGPAMKFVADLWTDAGSADRPTLLAAADVLRQVDVAGFALWTMVLVGVTPLVLGLAVVASGDHPSWLGWVAMATGTVGIVQGLITFHNGLTPVTVFVLAPTAVFATITWIVVMGLFVSWRGEPSPSP